MHLRRYLGLSRTIVLPHRLFTISDKRLAMELFYIDGNHRVGNGI